MFCRLDIKGDCLGATRAVGRTLNQAIRKIGLSQFENPQGPNHLVCIFNLELLGANDAVQRQRDLGTR